MGVLIIGNIIFAIPRILIAMLIGGIIGAVLSAGGLIGGEGMGVIMIICFFAGLAWYVLAELC